MSFAKSKVIILKDRAVPSLYWRFCELTAEQARAWANELQTAANLAEQSFGLQEAARESKEGK